MMDRADILSRWTLLCQPHASSDAIAQLGATWQFYDLIP